MPKDTLKALDADIERLMFAGGAVARTDSHLGTRAGLLAHVGGKVPVMGRLADQVRKIQSAQGTTVVAELLSLACAMVSVRASLSQPAQTAGESLSLPATHPIETPLSAVDLEQLYSALTDRGNKYDLVSGCIERHAFLDLRLLPLWIKGLEKTDLEPLITKQVLPAYGLAATTLLEALYRPTGGRNDGSRLRALVHLGGESNLFRLREALAQGSDTVRLVALESMTRLAHDEAVPHVIKTAREARGPLRLGAIALLADLKIPTSEVLDILVKGLSTSSLRDACARALGRIDHAKATERLIAFITEQTTGFKPYRAAPRKGKKLTTAQQKQAQSESAKWSEKLEAILSAIQALRTRNDSSSLLPLLDLWKASKVYEIVNEVGQSLRLMGSPDVLDAFETHVKEVAQRCSDYVLDAILSWRHERAFDYFSPWFSKSARAKKGTAQMPTRILQSLAYAVYDEESDDGTWSIDEEIPESRINRQLDLSRKRWKEDPRWADLLLPLLNDKVLGDQSLDLLGQARDVRVLPFCLHRLTQGVRPSDTVIETLGRLGDKRATIPVWEQVRKSTHSGFRQTCLECLRRLDDPSIVAEIQTFMSATKSPRKGARKAGGRVMNNWEIEHFEKTLRHLTRNRTLDPLGEVED